MHTGARAAAAASSSPLPSEGRGEASAPPWCTQLRSWHVALECPLVDACDAFCSPSCMANDAAVRVDEVSGGQVDSASTDIVECDTETGVTVNDMRTRSGWESDHCLSIAYSAAVLGLQEKARYCIALSAAAGSSRARRARDAQ